MIKRKFGLLDLVIILIIICLGIIGFKVLSGHEKTDTSKQNISFVVEIKGAEESVLQAIETNDILYNSKNDTMLGKVKDFNFNKATEVTADINSSKYTTQTYNDKYDIYIEVDALADSNTEKHIMLAEEKLKIGSMLHFASSDFVASGYIVKINRLEEDK